MKTTLQSDQLLTIRQVAALLKISVRTIYQHIQIGVFPRPMKIRGAARWSAEDFKKYPADLDAHRELVRKRMHEKALASARERSLLAKPKSKRIRRHERKTIPFVPVYRPMGNPLVWRASYQYHGVKTLIDGQLHYIDGREGT